MPKCAHCNYELVLLSSRPKYKCAICSKLYSKKEIEGKEFRRQNQFQKQLNIQEINQELEKNWSEIRELQKGIKLLFNWSPKTYSEEFKAIMRIKNREWRLKNRDYDLKRKKQYYEENKKKINLKAKKRRKNNLELHNQRKKEWREKNIDQNRINGQISFWRNRQKELALEMFGTSQEE